jgi:hypothetical protein
MLLLLLLFPVYPSHIGVSLFVFDYFLNWFSFSIWPIRLSSIILPGSDVASSGGTETNTENAEQTRCCCQSGDVEDQPKDGVTTQLCTCPTTCTYSGCLGVGANCHLVDKVKNEIYCPC